MSQIAFVTWNGGGNLGLAQAIARGLQRRGHRRRPGSGRADRRSWRYQLSFADHSDTAGGHGQTAGPVVFLVHPDRCALGDDYVLVQDGVLDDGAAADPGIVQDHRPVHPGPAIYPGSRR